MTSIHAAACKGNSQKLLDALKRGEDVNERDVDCGGRTALHWAASLGHVDCCRKLVANGADPEIKSFAGWTPLHSAAEAGHVDCIRYLLMATAVKASERDKAGDTARRVAERYGHRDCVKLLKGAEDSEQKLAIAGPKNHKLSPSTKRNSKSSKTPEGSPGRDSLEERDSHSPTGERNLEYNSEDDLKAIGQRLL